jgi:hypothetical protein
MSSYTNTVTKTIQVNYDLVSPGQSYAAVATYLKSHGTWARPLKSMWFLRTTKTAAQIRDELTSIVDQNDEVVVLDVTGVPWATNFSDDTVEWMEQNMLVGVRVSL